MLKTKELSRTDIGSFQLSVIFIINLPIKPIILFTIIL